MELAPFRLLPVFTTMTLQVSGYDKLCPDTYAITSSDIAISAYAGIIIVVNVCPLPAVAHSMMTAYKRRSHHHNYKALTGLQTLTWGSKIYMLLCCLLVDSLVPFIVKDTNFSTMKQLSQ